MRFNFLANIKEWIFGAPRDPFHPEIKRHIALIAFFAWVGLGADGLSSSSYGPEEAFLALGNHYHLGLYLAIMTAVTVFIISLAYNQVIELFPSGGGGYKVSSQLLGPKFGLISGAALIVDYFLTIATSVASSVDTLFSLLPLSFQEYKLFTEMGIICFLTMLNIRGVKESIKILLPLFVGFFVSHVALIGYGIIKHAGELGQIVPNALQETASAASELGWVFTISLLLRAYSLGGGTYTGIEAVSNNVNILKEPRIKTGRLTMLYMALSLSFVAGGIILLYLLWYAQPVPGQTLNAVVFGSMLASFPAGNALLAFLLLSEMGLLIVAANTGFLGGPAVLANMAVDGWVPRQFRQLSSRLVTQNGVTLFGIAALVVLLWTRGRVSALVVLYSINVFITFSLAMLGLCVHWWQHRKRVRTWKRKFSLSVIGCTITLSILCVTVVEKFGEGGWMTIFITSIVVGGCLLIKRHYLQMAKNYKKIDAIFQVDRKDVSNVKAMSLDPEAPTAVLFVSRSAGVGVHSLMWIQRLFPDVYKNFIFAGVGEVDIENFNKESGLEEMQKDLITILQRCTEFSRREGLASTYYYSFGADDISEILKLADKISERYHNCVFFASSLIFINQNWLTRFLHNRTAETLQRKLHLRNKQMVILPMKI